MTDIQQSSKPKRLGAGRSGQVFLVETQGKDIARKIFTGDKATKVIHYCFFGAPNPYMWNQDAIQCAYLRRQILAELVKIWFGSKLRVAAATGTSWNPEFQAYQLDTEFIAGRTIFLQQPFALHSNRELSLLVKGIMQPLQQHLIDSGFDGLVWQAGKGNPVALNNFLLISSSTSEYEFIWIDLESGVPALIPMNPLVLLSFYLPKSFKHGRALFDDVDTVKLKQYVHDCQASLEAEVGSDRYLSLLAQIEQLEHHQQQWKQMPRVHRSIQYRFTRGDLTEEQVLWYLDHPLQWHGREFKRLVQTAIQRIFGYWPTKLINKLKSIAYRDVSIRLGKLLVSQRYRLQVARNYVTRRIQNWRERSQLNSEEAHSLLNRLYSEHTSDYLADFGVHLGISIFNKAIIENLFFVFLYSMGFINEITLGFLIIAGGAIYRTIYTLLRMAQAVFTGQDIPWIAFWVGLVPLIGNLAYPCQMIYSAVGRQGKIARFIVYDMLTHMGDKFPIWGGEDTLTEHFFNRWADRMVHCFETEPVNSDNRVIS